MTNLTHAKLKEIIHYDCDSGEFFWRGKTKNQHYGKLAGSLQSMGYWSINVFYKSYLAHRLAWFYCYEEWPDQYIDHINGDTLDNRIYNLRKATQSQNLMNRGKTVVNTSGFKGVCKHRNKWTASIKVQNKSVYLGIYETPELAHEAYINAVAQYHGEFARVA